jgi:predicted esterase YcpF (UPF0227 family)
MNILFLHGLESKLSEPKRVILEKYGQVIAPDLDYKSNPNMIEDLYTTYHNQNISVIIGSSMGGFAGYYLAQLLKLPSMLYNPALPYRSSIEQIVPSHLAMNHPASMRIVLGSKDTVIKAKDNLAFLAQHISEKTDYKLVIRKELAHQIPVAVFEEETLIFLKSQFQETKPKPRSYPPLTTCHSGGVIGTDDYFERICSHYKIPSIAYSYKAIYHTSQNKYELSEEEYQEGVLQVYQSNKGLKKINIKDNLNRYASSWFQVKNAEQIFAIATFIEKGKKRVVEGQTGMTVRMAIDHQKEVYVFEQDLNEWFYWDYYKKGFIEMIDPPKITASVFAGIGTCDINPCGIAAIEELFLPPRELSKEEKESVEEILKFL